MKNYVFDLYGTLADIKTDEDDPVFRKKFAKYFLRYNANIDFWTEYKKLCAQKDTGGYCEIDLLTVFKQIANCNKETALEIASVFRRLSRKKLKAYRGVKGLLKSLKEKGAHIYLLSNAQACFTDKELDKLRLRKYFDGIELSSVFGEKKPSVRFFGYLTDKYGLDKSQTVYIGNDIKSDIEGAKAAGLKTAYILSNLSPECDSLEEAEKAADFSTVNFKELSRFLLNI